ncbi:hypothetical protein [Hymenobacter jejuensis]|uniref:Uncharacterized protein n=1 Tax=Hymenobacter jejuensis TaxID=2502781 RepID=A0A5B8A3T4_9BACT|nr:hypothetical protein [Hymenobacter jejuensis]QDA61799.1 hypothetical protein FHG12_17610 [Hymenobacter jejuensis]
MLSLLMAFFVESHERRRLEREQTPREVWNKHTIQPDNETFNHYFWDVYLPASKWRFVLAPLLWFNRLFN